jgi:hypothetical protein
MRGLESVCLACARTGDDELFLIGGMYDVPQAFGALLALMLFQLFPGHNLNWANAKQPDPFESGCSNSYCHSA